MKEGVFDVIPAGALDSLTSEDLRLLLNGVGDINVTTLISYTSFNDESGETSERLVTFKRWLWAVIEKMSPLDKQDLVYFWTGEITQGLSAALNSNSHYLSRFPSFASQRGGIPTHAERHHQTGRRQSSPLRQHLHLQALHPSLLQVNTGSHHQPPHNMDLYFSKQILETKLQLALKTKNFGFV